LPASTSDQQRVLLAGRRDVLAAGARHRGWKIGRDLPDVDGIAFGYLTSATELENGAHYGPWTSTLRGEVELAIVVGTGFAVALELVDVARTPGGAIVANSFHRAVAYGPSVEDPSIGAASLTIDDRRYVADADVYEPDAVLRSLSSLLAAVGEQLHPGDRVLCGSVVHEPVPPGARLTAEIAGLGEVSVRLHPG
jgi:2-keto-4-pentenoate hydratase